jgi:hypothetical protein
VRYNTVKTRPLNDHSFNPTSLAIPSSQQHYKYTNVSLKLHINLKTYKSCKPYTKQTTETHCTTMSCPKKTVRWSDDTKWDVDKAQEFKNGSSKMRRGEESDTPIRVKIQVRKSDFLKVMERRKRDQSIGSVLEELVEIASRVKVEESNEKKWEQKLTSEH